MGIIQTFSLNWTYNLVSIQNNCKISEHSHYVPAYVLIHGLCATKPPPPATPCYPCSASPASDSDGTHLLSIVDKIHR